MKSNASTQTKHVPTPLADELLEDDPLVVSSNRIVAELRCVEYEILRALGLPRTEPVAARGTSRGTSEPFAHAFEDHKNAKKKDADVPSFRIPTPSVQSRASSAAPAPSTTLTSIQRQQLLFEDHSKARLATLTSSIIRQAEDSILEELGKVAALVPHGEQGYAYTRARLSPSRQDVLRQQEATYAKHKAILDRQEEQLKLASKEMSENHRLTSPSSKQTHGGQQHQPNVTPIPIERSGAYPPRYLDDGDDEVLEIMDDEADLVETPGRRRGRPRTPSAGAGAGAASPYRAVTPVRQHGLVPMGVEHGSQQSIGVERVSRLQDLADKLLRNEIGGTVTAADEVDVDDVEPVDVKPQQQQRRRRPSSPGPSHHQPAVNPIAGGYFASSSAMSTSADVSGGAGIPSVGATSPGRGFRSNRAMSYQAQFDNIMKKAAGSVTN